LAGLAFAASRDDIRMGSRPFSHRDLPESGAARRCLETGCDDLPLFSACLSGATLPGTLMILVLPYPQIDPVFLHIGRIQLRWYGLMYMVSFILGYFIMKKYARYRKLELSTDDLYDLLFYLILGVMIGGRLGYVLFYDLNNYLLQPLTIFAIWQGGMSFHGGFIGVIIAAWWICRKKGWNFWEIADLVSVAVPIGLGLGRIGNFINGELFGRPTNVAWAMVFPDGG